MDRGQQVEYALVRIGENKRFNSSTVREIIERELHIETAEADICAVMRNMRKGDNPFHIVRWRKGFIMTTNKYILGKARKSQAKKVTAEKLILKGI